MITIEEATKACDEYIDDVENVVDLMDPMLWSKHIQATFQGIENNEFVYMMRLMIIKVNAAINTAMMLGMAGGEGCAQCRAS